MSTRTLIFISLATLIMLAASLLRKPVVPPNNNPANPALAESVDGANENEGSKTNPDVTDQLENESVEDLADVDGDIEQTAGADDAETKSKPDKNASLYTLGSIAPDSNSRFLVTLTSSGGSVRRVELNFRDKKAKLRYRDLEYEGGYLGELDCLTSTLGCQIRVVGDGTPAALAGLKSGDVIRAINGEPVTEADDFQKMMSKTRPGSTIELSYTNKAGEESSVPIELVDKPIELIRPEPDTLEEGNFGAPSFLTTLRATAPLREVWPEFDSEMMNGPWEVENQSEDQIVFSYTISKEQLQSNPGLKGFEQPIEGPIKISKTYSLPATSDIASHEQGQKDFHFDLKIEIENLSESKLKCTYQIDGPLGTPSETWWYQNKIHGRNTAVGYIAGARDVIGSSGQSEFTFFGGPELVSNLEKTQPENFWLLEPPLDGGDESQIVNFMSVDTQYFNIALLPAGDSPFSAYSVLADVVQVEVPENKREQKLVDVTFKLFKNIEIAASESYSQQFEIFAGPKEPEILADYGLEEARSFGWFAMFSKPLCWLLKLFYNLTFKFGYGIPIILLTILVRSFMIPISRRAAINAQMMQYLQPQMKEIADKYKDDMEKRSQAQRNLFKKYNYNPFGGCFMMFLQIPIFIGLYRGLSVDIALRDQPLFPGLNWCTNLSAPDQLWYWKDSLPQFMSFLTDETGWLGPYFNLLPIITCVLFIVQQKLFTPPPTDEQQEMMQKVMKFAMIFMGFLFFKVPAGLCLYFITSSSWGIIERKMLPKPELDKSKLDDLLDDEDVVDKATLKKKEKARLQSEKADQLRLDGLEEKKKRDKERKKKLKKRGDNESGR